MNINDLGLIPYKDAWQMQEELHKKRVAGEIPDTVLLLEHPPVFTIGRRDCEADIISPNNLIERDGIEIVKTNRGGRVTYHGPGQLMCYFICAVSGVKEFVYSIEEICLKTISEFGLKGSRDPEHPGIWVGKEKIAAIGLHISHGVSQHGFALNVSPNLLHYKHILPCGIQDKGITSLKKLLGKDVSVNEVKKSVSKHLESILVLRDAEG